MPIRKAAWSGEILAMDLLHYAHYSLTNKLNFHQLGTTSRHRQSHRRRARAGQQAWTLFLCKSPIIAFERYSELTLILHRSTYDMNQLQSLPESRHGSIFLTLNPPFDVDPSKVVGRYQYEHPMYSAKVSTVVSAICCTSLV